MPLTASRGLSLSVDARTKYSAPQEFNVPCSKKRVNVAGEKKRTGLKNLAGEANLASLMAT